MLNPSSVPSDNAAATCKAADGAQGLVDAKGKHCCPLGCGRCGGEGCGRVPLAKVFLDGRELPEGAESSDYCCIKTAFTATTGYCDETGVEPPCLVRDGTFAICGVPDGGWGRVDSVSIKPRSVACQVAAAAVVMLRTSLSRLGVSRCSFVARTPSFLARP